MHSNRPKKSVVVLSRTMYLQLLVMCWLFTIAPLASAAEAIIETMPEEIASLIPQSRDGCLNVFGQYKGRGRVYPDKPYVEPLGVLLRASHPDFKYGPDAAKYTTFETLEILQDQKLKITITIIGEVSRSTIKDVTCEDGWVRLEERGKHGIEAGTAKFHTIILLTPSVNGDLVVKYFAKTRASTLFGLIWTNSTDRYWYVYPKYNPNP